MNLYLIESSLTGVVANKQELDKKAGELQSSLNEKGAMLIEVQVSKDLSRSFFIIEADNEEVATEELEKTGIAVELVKDVRLVGDDLEKVKQQRDVVNYLVEWNLPEDLTMDQYLARKKRKLRAYMRRFLKYHLQEHMYVKTCRNVYAFMMRRMKKL